MSREALQESLSAVMDNEADELELRRVINALDDVETRETWARYQIARAAFLQGSASSASGHCCGSFCCAGRRNGSTKVSRMLLAQPGSSGRCGLGDRCRIGRCSPVQSGRNRRCRAGSAVNQPSLTAPQVKGPAVLAGYKESSKTTGLMANGVLQGRARLA